VRIDASGTRSTVMSLPGRQATALLGCSAMSQLSASMQMAQQVTQGMSALCTSIAGGGRCARAGVQSLIVHRQPAAGG